MFFSSSSFFLSCDIHLRRRFSDRRIDGLFSSETTPETLTSRHRTRGVAPKADQGDSITFPLPNSLKFIHISLSVSNGDFLFSRESLLQMDKRPALPTRPSWSLLAPGCLSRTGCYSPSFSLLGNGYCASCMSHSLVRRGTNIYSSVGIVSPKQQQRSFAERPAGGGRLREAANGQTTPGFLKIAAEFLFLTSSLEASWRPIP